MLTKKTRGGVKKGDKIEENCHRGGTEDCVWVDNGLIADCNAVDH